MLQQCDQGGEFQFTQPFRNEANEKETYATADKVVNGDSTLINTLEFPPGQMLFNEFYTELISICKV